MVRVFSNRDGQLCLVVEESSGSERRPGRNVVGVESPVQKEEEYGGGQTKKDFSGGCAQEAITTNRECCRTTQQLSMTHAVFQYCISKFSTRVH